MVFNRGFNFSDHRQIEVCFGNSSVNGTNRGREGRFHYEDYWATIEGNKEVISNAWTEGLLLHSSDPIQSVRSAIGKCVDALKVWKGSIHPNFGKDIDWRQRKIERLRVDCTDARGKEELSSLEHEVANLLEQEELYWRQRSKSLWLKEGDQNTKYFHCKATQKRTKNFINFLLDDNDASHNSHSELCAIAFTYFRNLFKSSGSVQSNVEAIIDCLSRKVTDPMNQILTAGFSNAEIKAALFQMNRSKLPGPDGFRLGFIKKIGRLWVQR